VITLARPVFPTPLPRSVEADLDRDWLRMDGEHITVVYPRAIGPLAGHVLDSAEEVYRFLASWTGHAPPGRIPLLLSDSSDAAGGAVLRGGPGLYVRLFAVHPYAADGRDADRYRSWYRAALLHQLAHYFHFTMVGGMPSFLSSLLGGAIHPNTAAPHFYVEGFAGYAQRSGGEWEGPGAAWGELVIRTAAEGGNLPPFDQACSSPPVRPSGGRSAVCGEAFVRTLALRYGERTLHRLNRESGSSPPYTGMLAFRRVYGKPGRVLWEEWRGTLEEDPAGGFPRRVVREEDPLRAASGPSSEPRILASVRGRVCSLAFDPEGRRLFYSVQPRDGEGGLYLYDLSENRGKLLKRGLHAWNLVFTPGSPQEGSSLLYVRPELRRNVNLRRDIYRLDLESGRERRVTRRGHVQGFVPLDTGLLVCASTPLGTEIRLVHGGTDLLLYGPEGASGRFPAGTRLQVVEQPALSPDRSRVAFSCRDRSGNRSIYVAALGDLLAGDFLPVRATDPSHGAFDPVWIDERRILFVSDRDGAFELYALDTGGGRNQGDGAPGCTPVREAVTGLRGARGYPVAPGVTGLSAPAASPRGLAAARLTAGGTQVVLLPIRLSPPGAAGGRDAPSPRERSPGGQVPAGAARSPAHSRSPGEGAPRPPAASGKSETASYRALPWLAPAWWLPLYTSDAVGLGVGVSTRGGDLLQRHRYSAALVYDLLDAGLKTELRYTCHGYPLSLFCNLYLERRPPESPPDLAVYPGLSFSLIKRLLQLEADLGFKHEPPYLGPSLRITASTMDPAAWSLAPGRGSSLVLDVYLNARDRKFAVLTGEYTGYASLRPLLLSMRLRGRTAPGGGGLVRTGDTGDLAYVPLDGLYTPGYPEPVAGDTAADLLLKAGLPLRLEQGIGGLPLFFRGAVLSLFTAHGVLVSQEPARAFVADGWARLLEDPGRHVRTSWGPELQISVVAGYRVPVNLRVGYVSPLSPGGRAGIYAAVDAGLAF
jgi:hypothetical protein